MYVRSLVRGLCLCSMLAIATPAVLAQNDKPKMPEAVKDAAKQAQDAMKKAEPPAGMPQMTEDQQKEMEAWMAAAQPGKPHQWMAKLEGSWKTTMKMFDPAMGESSSQGEMKIVMIHGGRYQHSFYKGDFMGQPFEGSGLMGFNNITGKYESVWGDSMSTMMMVSYGEYDVNTNTLTMRGSFADPVTKKPIKSREVSQFKDENNWTMTFFHEKNGKEEKVMEISYVRQGDKPAADKSPMDKMKDDAMKKAKDAIDKAKPNMPGR